MRILVVAPWVPSPQRPRSFGLIQMLAEDHEVDIVAAAWNDNDLADLADLKVQHNRPIKMSKPVVVSPRSQEAFVTRRSVQQEVSRFSAKFRAALKKESAWFAPDIAYFNVIRSSQFLDAPLDGSPTTPQLVIDPGRISKSLLRTIVHRSSKSGLALLRTN